MSQAGRQLRQVSCCERLQYSRPRIFACCLHTCRPVPSAVRACLCPPGCVWTSDPCSLRWTTDCLGLEQTVLRREGVTGPQVPYETATSFRAPMPSRPYAGTRPGNSNGPATTCLPGIRAGSSVGKSPNWGRRNTASPVAAPFAFPARGRPPFRRSSSSGNSGSLMEWMA